MNALLFPIEMLPVQTRPDWPFGELRPRSFDLLMVDPPWAFAVRSPKGITAKGAGGQYATMTLDEIKALPVGELAAADAVMWLWATAPMLRQAIDAMAEWGFAYSTMGTWAKRTNTGKLRWGTGYRLRSTSEPFLIGTRGKPKTSRAIPSHIDGLAREHSRKPEECYRLAEKMLPSAKRVEIFSRQKRPGWDAWGFESDKFKEPAA